MARSYCRLLLKILPRVSSPSAFAGSSRTAALASTSARSSRLVSAVALGAQQQRAGVVGTEHDGAIEVGDCLVVEDRSRGRRRRARPGRRPGPCCRPWRRRSPRRRRRCAARARRRRWRRRRRLRRRSSARRQAARRRARTRSRRRITARQKRHGSKRRKMAHGGPLRQAQSNAAHRRRSSFVVPPGAERFERKIFGPRRQPALRVFSFKCGKRSLSNEPG